MSLPLERAPLEVSTLTYNIKHSGKGFYNAGPSFFLCNTLLVQCGFVNSPFRQLPSPQMTFCQSTM
jgi:hypothetical protein